MKILFWWIFIIRKTSTCFGLQKFLHQEISGCKYFLTSFCVSLCRRMLRILLCRNCFPYAVLLTKLERLVLELFPSLWLGVSKIDYVYELPKSLDITSITEKSRSAASRLLADLDLSFTWKETNFLRFMFKFEISITPFFWTIQKDGGYIFWNRSHFLPNRKGQYLNATVLK